MDTIKLILSNDTLNGGSMLEYIQANPNLSNFMDVKISEKSGIRYGYGLIRNVKFSVYDTQLIMNGFSLNKWVYGNNLTTMNEQSIRYGIEELSDVFNLPINDSKVSRLDFGKCLELENNPNLYFKYLGSCGRYHRFEQPTAVYYQKGKCKLVLYDKIKEMKSKREEIPNEFQNKNILRYIIAR